MTAEPADTRATSTWPAVAWAESFTLLGLGLMAYGFFTTALNCLGTLGDCSAEDPTSGSGPMLMLAGVVAFGGAVFLAAHLSGQESAFASGLLALIGLLGTLVLSAAVFGLVLQDVTPALVPALAVEGLVAIRVPSAKAMRARLVVVAALVIAALLLSRAGADGQIILLALLVFPGLGLADSIAASRPS